MPDATPVAEKCLEFLRLQAICLTLVPRQPPFWNSRTCHGLDYEWLGPLQITALWLHFLGHLAAKITSRDLKNGFSTGQVFSDYMRPPIRLSAIMETPCIFVFTHDSIGVGEDGPTHQPVEHLGSLRSIPGLAVFRPCDPILKEWGEKR